MNEDEPETAESALDKVLAGRSLLEVFTPRSETTALLRELRRDPTTRTILDGNRLDQVPPVDSGEVQQSPSTQSQSPQSCAPDSSPGEQNPDILGMVVDYANGMTQAEIACKHGLHVQTVRKRLKSAGVVARTHRTALTDQELIEARTLLDGGSSTRKIAQQFGVTHTTLLRSLRRGGF